MNLMTNSFFLDTNILVYAFDRSSPKKGILAQKLLSRAIEDANGYISWQVAQEFLSLATKKFKIKLQEAEAARVLEDLLRPLWQVQPSVELFQKSLQIHKKYKYSFYDSLILSAALVTGCDVIYSEDFQNKQKIEDLTVVNPFG